MTKVLDKVIGECQHAFAGDKQILDTALIANEVVDELVNKKTEWILRKLDMEKTYNNVNWGFVDYMLMKLGFGVKWRRWVK